MAAEELGGRVDHDVGACSNGRIRYGVAMVLSTMSGMLWRLATWAIAAMSVITPPGLAIDSMKIALVRGVIAASNEAGSSVSAQTTFQPKSCRSG